MGPAVFSQEKNDLKKTDSSKTTQQESPRKELITQRDSAMLKHHLAWEGDSSVHKIKRENKQGPGKMSMPRTSKNDTAVLASRHVLWRSDSTLKHANRLRTGTTDTGNLFRNRLDPQPNHRLKDHLMWEGDSSVKKLPRHTNQ